ncbi:MAG TPA: hypothetical protein DCZ23_05380, partial [Lachnospiraceae bacterium]|nr:hypothetical protein [Lachnospiraceae bacterium]
MGIKQDNKNLGEIIQKIGLPRIIIIILAGIVLVVTSVADKKEKDNASDDIYYTKNTDKAASIPETLSESAALDAMAEYTAREEKKLEEVLGEVEGIGKVKVMITLASSEERMTLQNTDNTENSTDENDMRGGSRKKQEYSSKSENVIISSDGGEHPYVVQVNSPRIEGVAVVAQGAGTGKKDSEIIDAVVALFSI